MPSSRDRPGQPTRRSLLTGALAVFTTRLLPFSAGGLFAGAPALAARPPRRAKPRPRHPPSHGGHADPTRPVPVRRPPPHRLPPHLAHDPRWARPAPAWVRTAVAAHHPPPAWRWYRPWYTRWWVHPYYRWRSATWIVVDLRFPTVAWEPSWLPPPRPGWVWVPARFEGATRIPGYWTPATPGPVGYVYVPGWWIGTAYAEGYWRAEIRTDGDWAWVPGSYNADGSYVWGHWVPSAPAPSGYSWEPGYWDGEEWVEGYWRPLTREGYSWVPAQFELDGTYNAGYWRPVEERPGYTWVPGWFDGNGWIEGYWVADTEYQSANPEAWIPEEGWDDGRNEVPEAPDEAPIETEAPPLAIPVDVAR